MLSEVHCSLDLACEHSLNDGKCDRTFIIVPPDKIDPIFQLLFEYNVFELSSFEVFLS